MHKYFVLFQGIHLKFIYIGVILINFQQFFLRISSIRRGRCNKKDFKLSKAYFNDTE